MKPFHTGNAVFYFLVRVNLTPALSAKYGGAKPYAYIVIATSNPNGTGDQWRYATTIASDEVIIPEQAHELCRNIKGDGRDADPRTNSFWYGVGPIGETPLDTFTAPNGDTYFTMESGD